ncbi:RmlC-like cupins superfamily protein [Tanacetum coccineum]
MARALLFQANFPLHLWGYYILTATYLINRLPSRAIDNKSPYEVLYNSSPLLEHLRVSGCKANAYNLTKHKFEPKFTPCVLLGYPQTQKGYILYDPKTYKTITTRNVTFEEHNFPLHSTNTPISQIDPFTSPLQFSSEQTPIPTTINHPHSTHTTPNTPPSPIITHSSPTTSSNSPIQTPTTPLSPNDNTIESQNSTHTPLPPPPPSPPTRQSSKTKSILTNLKDFQYTLPKSFMHNDISKHHHSNYSNDRNLSSSHLHFKHNVNNVHEPHSYFQASKDPKWIEAMQKEIEALEHNNVTTQAINPNTPKETVADPNTPTGEVQSLQRIATPPKMKLLLTQCLVKCNKM